MLETNQLTDAEKNNLIADVTALLKGNKSRVFSTSLILSRLRLKKAYQHLEQRVLETVLAEYVATAYPLIYRVYYPLGQDFDHWWGYGYQYQPYQDRRDELLRMAREAGASDLTESASSFFVSYNSEDLDKVISLRKILNRRGYGAWIAHAENTHTQEAVDFVGANMQKFNYFLIYLSRNATSSTWVRQECKIATEDYQKPALVVFDGNDHQLLHVMRFVSMHPTHPQSIALEIKRRLGVTGNKNMRAFLHKCSQLINVSEISTAYPYPVAVEPAMLADLRIRPIDEALSRFSTTRKHR